MRKFLTSTPVVFALYIGMIAAGQHALKSLGAPRMVSVWAPVLALGTSWYVVLGRLEKKNYEDAEQQLLAHLDERNQALIEEMEKRDVVIPPTLN